MWYGSFAYFGSALEQGSNRSSAARKFDDAGRGGGGVYCALLFNVCVCSIGQRLGYGMTCQLCSCHTRISGVTSRARHAHTSSLSPETEHDFDWSPL
jgi:hypothetical protein